MNKCPKCASGCMRKSRKQPKNNQPSGRFKAAFRCNDCGTRFVALDPGQISLFAIPGIAVLLVMGTLWSVVSKPSSNPELERSRAADETVIAVSTSVPPGQNDVTWFEQNGDQERQHRLAKALLRESSLNSDPQPLGEAVRSLREAASGGHAQAQSDLGTLYLEGRGVVQDFVQATTWYRKAADQGNSQAMLGLGKMARSGWGTEPDLIEAYVWLNLAAARGEADAIAARREVTAQLTADQLNAAQAKSRELDQRIP